MQPQRLVTEKHGRWARLTNPPGAYFWVMSLLFQGQGGEGGGVAERRRLVVKAGSDGGELPERCRALINHRKFGRGSTERGGNQRQRSRKVFLGLVG